MTTAVVRRIWNDTVQWGESQRPPLPLDEVLQAFARQIEQEAVKQFKKEALR